MTPSAPHRVLLYVAILSASVLALLLIIRTGENVFGRAAYQPAVPALPGASHWGMLPHILLALTVILVTAKAVGGLFKYCGQPAVIGEIIAGIVLGPSLLGRIFPESMAFLLPADLRYI